MRPTSWMIAAVAALAFASPVLASSKPAPKPPMSAKPAPSAKPTAVPVTVTGAWIREAPPGAKAMGGYLTIANHSSKALILTGVTSPVFGSVEMHNVVSENGRMAMKQAQNFVVLAGGTLEFKPRDRHLMLMAPNVPLHDGDTVPLTLHFGETKVEVTAEVRKVKH